MNFLFTIDESYVAPCKVLMFSIYKNMGDNQRFYFIYQHISFDKRKELFEYAKEKCKSETIFIKYDNKKLKELPVLGTWSVEIYFRLFAPYLIQDADVILYLDGDTIVNGELSELYDLSES